MRKLILLLMSTCMTLACNAQLATDTFETASGKKVVFTCIKHASIQISYEGRNIYIDPVTGLQPETDYMTMPKANYILITHEHPDHFDPLALTQLRLPNTVVYANPSVCSRYVSGFELVNGDSLSITDDIHLKAVPAYNTTPDRQKFHPKGRDNGYVLTIENLRIYIAGDTEDIPEMSNLAAIDIAFLPCNQPYTMTPEQLVRAAKVIRPKVLFPYHYSDTPIRKIPLLLKGCGIDVRIRAYK